MQLAILSDTHMPRGTRSLPDGCVSRLRSADAILHCGDFMRVEVLDQIEAYGPPVHAVSGNVDDENVRQRVPSSQRLELEGVRIGMIHIPGAAKGRLARLRWTFPDTDAVVFGHTHMPEHEEHDGFQIFNPGSPTERRRAPTHTMGMATIADAKITFELIALT